MVVIFPVREYLSMSLVPTAQVSSWYTVCQWRPGSSFQSEGILSAFPVGQALHQTPQLCLSGNGFIYPLCLDDSFVSFCILVYVVCVFCMRIYLCMLCVLYVACVCFMCMCVACICCVWVVYVCLCVLHVCVVYLCLWYMLVHLMASHRPLGSAHMRFCSPVFIHFSSCSTNWIMSVGLSQYIYL